MLNPSIQACITVTVIAVFFVFPIFIFPTSFLSFYRNRKDTNFFANLNVLFFYSRFYFLFFPHLVRYKMPVKRCPSQGWSQILLRFSSDKGCSVGIYG